MAAVGLMLGVLALASACGSEPKVDSKTNVAAAAPAADDLGCDFAGGLAPPADPSKPKLLTQADVDKAVKESPAEIREDVRVIMQAMLTVSTESEKMKGLPPQEMAAKAMELSQITQSPEYLAAFERFGAYIAEHCPGFAKLMEDATQS